MTQYVTCRYPKGKPDGRVHKDTCRTYPPKLGTSMIWSQPYPSVQAAENALHAIGDPGAHCGICKP